MTERQKQFKARLEGIGPGGAWTLLRIPFDVEKAFGSRARVSVKGTINRFAYRSSIFPSGDGTHHLMVNKAMQQGAGAKAGDSVRVVMGPDTAPRPVTLPPAFRKALARNKRAKVAFDRLPPSHKKEFVGYIVEAKKLETRARRIQKVLALLRKKQRVKD